MTDKDWRICQVGNVYYIEKWMGWWGFGYQLYFENEKTVRFLSLSAATEWVRRVRKQTNSSRKTRNVVSTVYYVD